MQDSTLDRIGWLSGLLLALQGCGDPAPSGAVAPAPASVPASAPALPSRPPPAEADAPAPRSEPAGEAEAWIPEPARGWTRTDTVRHDFDGDGAIDIALVLTHDDADSSDEDRLLVVGLAEGDAHRLVLQTSCIALCTGCGGMMGDPYTGMTQVGERSLKIGNYGGSSLRWSSEYTLAWRDGGMKVVGFDGSHFRSTSPDEGTVLSINLLNGKATENDVTKRHDQGAVPAQDCSAVGKLSSVALR